MTQQDDRMPKMRSNKTRQIHIHQIRSSSKTKRRTQIKSNKIRILCLHDWFKIVF